MVGFGLVGGMGRGGGGGEVSEMCCGGLWWGRLLKVVE